MTCSFSKTTSNFLFLKIQKNYFGNLGENLYILQSKLIDKPRQWCQGATCDYYRSDALFGQLGHAQDGVETPKVDGEAVFLVVALLEENLTIYIMTFEIRILKGIPWKIFQCSIKILLLKT